MKNKTPKTKRIKKCFQNMRQVSELWAKQSQETAYCRQGSFEGVNIYSYGYHYLLGRIMEINGKRIAVVNFTKWSRTTSSHSWDASRAAESAGLKVYKIEGLDCESKSIFKEGTDDFDLHRAVIRKLKEESDLLNTELKNSQTKNLGWMFSHYFLDSVKEFNKAAEYLGLADLVIKRDKEFNTAYKIGCTNEKNASRASTDWNTRIQLPLDFNNPTKMFPASLIRSFTRGYQKRVS